MQEFKMTQYIVELDVSRNADEESKLRDQGFTKLEGNLTEGAGGSHVYLWYKKGDHSAITRIQVSFTEDMAKGLSSEGYRQILKDLNYGAGGNEIYLWFYCGSSEYDVPITDLYVSMGPEDGAMRFRDGWERVACNLNRGCGGNWIHLFFKRETETYICDITATNSYVHDIFNYKNGYIRLDEDTNKMAQGAWVFIWYRQTTSSDRAIKDIQVSTNDSEYQNLQARGYKVVNIDLNQVPGGNEIFLWYEKKMDVKKPIKATSLILNPKAPHFYTKAGVTVIPKNLNPGPGNDVYLCYND